MVNILFLYHHKTGHNLTRDIVNLLIKHYNKNINKIVNQIPPRKYIKKKNKIEMYKLKTKNNDNINIYIQGSPYIKIDEPDLKIVHFTRDPYKMCISSYLYHKQYPTPEKWVYRLNIYNYDIDIISYMIEILGLKKTDILNILNYIKSIYIENKTYYDNLRLLDLEKGIQLEACRSIISNGIIAGGDTLRMGYYNELLKKRSNCLKVKMANFNNKKIHQSINNIIKFLFNDNTFDSTIISNELLLIQKYKEKNGNHITKNKCTKEEKEYMKNILKNNLYIKKIFSKIKKKKLF